MAGRLRPLYVVVFLFFSDPAFLSEYFSQSSQTLSFYSWYGSAKIFRFRVPEDTVLLRWLLQASRDKGSGCGKTQVTL